MADSPALEEHIGIDMSTRESRTVISMVRYMPGQDPPYDVVISKMVSDACDAEDMFDLDNLEAFASEQRKEA